MPEQMLIYGIHSSGIAGGNSNNILNVKIREKSENIKFENNIILLFKLFRN
jgi:hypothetical protein